MASTNETKKAQTQSLIDQSRLNYATGRIGIITSYDPYDNTASVALSKEQSNEIEEIMTKVPCPVILGVQSVAPSPGLPCWVMFKDGKKTQPLIVSFFNHRYDQYNYSSQTRANVALPLYLTSGTQ